jgi:hypothetical protein
VVVVVVVVVLVVESGSWFRNSTSTTAVAAEAMAAKAVSKSLSMAFRRPGRRILGFVEEWPVGSDGAMMNGEDGVRGEKREGEWRLGVEEEELDVLVSRGILLGGPAGKAM